MNESTINAVFAWLSSPWMASTVGEGIVFGPDAARLVELGMDCMHAARDYLPQASGYVVVADFHQDQCEAIKACLKAEAKSMGLNPFRIYTLPRWSQQSVSEYEAEVRNLGFSLADKQSDGIVLIRRAGAEADSVLQALANSSKKVVFLVEVDISASK